MMTNHGLKALQVERLQAVIAEGEGDFAAVVEVVFDHMRHGNSKAERGAFAEPLPNSQA
ncbi:MAG TPA: hypothetical protein VIL85_12435 [Thermomicrobiales bacterium]|jgi:hypothetical protein